MRFNLIWLFIEGSRDTSNGCEIYNWDPDARAGL